MLQSAGKWQKQKNFFFGWLWTMVFAGIIKSIFFFKDLRSTCSFDQIQPAIYQHQYLRRRKKKIIVPSTFVLAFYQTSQHVLFAVILACIVCSFLTLLVVSYGHVCSSESLMDMCVVASVCAWVSMYMIINFNKTCMI